MAKKAVKKKPKGKKAKRERKPFRPIRWLLRWLMRGALIVAGFLLLMIVAYTFINPPTTPYMVAEGKRLGERVDHEWVYIEEIAPIMARAAVAAEDADFCLHWGLDMSAIRAAAEGGSVRGGSTISQQVVKNVFLWQGRSWLRKGLEALMTPMVEIVWSKQRILEVYLNVAEFDEGVFGVEAASRNYFRVGPEALSPTQAARLAAILPSPKRRSAANPSNATRRRAAQIIDGAATIGADGRADCFED